MADQSVGLHLRGLGLDAATVETLAVDDVLTQGERVIGISEILAVYGDTGVGKTFSIEHMLRSVGKPWVRLELMQKVTHAQFISLLGEAVFGVMPHGQSPKVAREVQDALIASPMVVWLDEAQHAPRASIQRLRVMHAQKDSDWSLILSGFGIEHQLRQMPEADDRVAAWVHVEPLRGKELLDALRNYHPVFASTDAALLKQIDNIWAGGHWRRWARVLQAGLPVLRARNRDAFDAAIADIVLSAIRGPLHRAPRGTRRPAPLGPGLEMAARQERTA